MLSFKGIINIVLSICFVFIVVSSKAQTPTYEMYITNQLQIDTKTYQFDVFVLSTGTPVLELANIQLGIGIDTSITNGGTLSFNMVSGSSQLLPSQVPQNFVVGGAFYTINGIVYRYLNQTQRTGPGAGNGTIISKIKTNCSSPGTRIGTYRLTNTKDFKVSSLTKHIFNTTSGTQRVASAVTCYVNGVNTTAIGTYYNYNTLGTCDENLVLNECQVSVSVTTTPVIYYGESTGTATVTLTGAGESSTGTYKLDGGLSIAFTSNPFVVYGLNSGTHSINITTDFCESNTENFTIEEPGLELPPIPNNIKVTTISVGQNSKTYRFEVMENLPPATPIRIAANGWQWQFTGNLTLGQNVILDSGTTNTMGLIDSKKFKVIISNNRITTLCDNVKVCYTSLIGNGPYQTTYSMDLYFKTIPVPTHIVVKALAPSPEGYRRFRYSAPDSFPVATDSIIQPTGWQWSFRGNLSEHIIIDSGNTNSKDIIVKLLSNEPENAGDKIMLSYLSECGTSGFVSTKFTYTTGHKYIFDNHYLEFDGNLSNGFSEFWDNPNNWNEYPGTNLLYGDTVIISTWCALNIPVFFDYGTVLIIDDMINMYNDLTSNGKIISNAQISFFSETANLLGNYFFENNDFFEIFYDQFNQPGTILNNGYCRLWNNNNTGHIINNGNFITNGNNYGIIQNNNPNEFYYYSTSNFGTIINNCNYSYSLSLQNESTGIIINNKTLNLSNFTNFGQVINNDTLIINGSLYNYNKLINHGNIVINNFSSIDNSVFYYLNPLTYLLDYSNGNFMNETDGKISGPGIISNHAIGSNKGEIKCIVSNSYLFTNENSGIIEGIVDNYNPYNQLDTSQNIFENRGIINLPASNGWFFNSYALFKNYGVINNYSPWAWEVNSYFKNYGTFNNYSEYYPSHTINYGIINNDSIINLFNEYEANSISRTIDNYSLINNNGAIIGSGDINNIGGITINNGIVSPGSTKNANIDSFNNNTTSRSSISSLSRSTINTISPSSNSETFKIGSLTFSNFTGTPTFEIEIADTNSISGHDFVTVNDTLNAGGTINLAISYIPNPNDEITIMHADTVLNQFDTVNIPAGWSVLYNHPNKGDISVKYDKTNLNVKAFLEGYYNGNNTMNTLLHNIGLTEDATAVDSIEVQMWSPDLLNLSDPTFSSKTILHNDGNANLSLPINMIGNNYYICIKHKNSIETWSAEPITISTVNNYDFTISQDKAYSNNFNNPLKSMPDGNFVIYSGDINQDGTIDIFDMMNTENDAANLFFGYGFTDCNGDGATDIFDIQIIENNSGLMIYYARPM